MVVCFFVCFVVFVFFCLKVSSVSLKYFDAECFIFSVWGGNVETWKKNTGFVKLKRKYMM